MEDEKLNLAQLAEEYGISKNAVRARLWRRGAKATPFNMQRLEAKVATMKPREAVEFLLYCCEILGGALATQKDHPVDKWGHLSPQQRRVAVALYDAQGRILTTGALVSALSFDKPDEASPELVKVLVCKLRKKLPPSVRIETVWGTGYKMVDSATD